MKTKKPDPSDLSFLDDATPNQPEPQAAAPNAYSSVSNAFDNVAPPEPTKPNAEPPKPEPTPEPVAPPVVALARRDVPPPAPIRFGDRGFMPVTFEDVQRLARAYMVADLIPRSTLAGARDQQAVIARVVLIIERAKALGIPAALALENMTVVNGRLSIWGDAMVAVVLGHPDCGGVESWIEGTGDDRVAHCVTHRRGRKTSPWTFSVADAKRAGLWGKSGPWSAYPERMLRIRARGFALRDTWADVLTGVGMVEEILDIPENRGHAAEAELLERMGRS